MENRNEEIKYMQRCIQLARCGMMGAPPNPMVGAVIVHEGRIIGEGFHRHCGGPHAEVYALRSVCQRDLLPQSTLYVSLEPCSHYGKTPPCTEAIIEARIPRVVVGCADPFARVNGQGIRRLREAGIQVRVGVLEEACMTLNRRFMTFHRLSRPWVTLKWAQSQDGLLDAFRTAATPPVHFSTPFTQTLVHRLRATHQAIMVGTRTVLLDNPTLTNRLWTGPHPLRVTIDRKRVLPSDAHLLDGQVPTVIYPYGDLQQILTDLHARGIQSLLVEGGATLLNSFLHEGCWDEARVEVAPLVLGHGIPAPDMGSVPCQSDDLVDGNRLLCYVREC